MIVFHFKLCKGPVGTLAIQSQIVLIMFFSFFLLKTRYRITHVLGAIVVICSVVMALIPSIGNLKSSNSIALIVLFLAPIPIVFAGIISQSLLQAGRVDAPTSLFFLVLFHACFHLISISIVPILQPGLAWNLNDITTNLRNGFTCLIKGTNSTPGDDCQYISIWFFAGYLMYLLISSMFMKAVERRMSAGAGNLSISAAIPGASLLFMIPTFGGFAFSWFTIGAVFLSVIGILLFRIYPERRKDFKALCEDEVTVTTMEDGLVPTFPKN